MIVVFVCNGINNNFILNRPRGSLQSGHVILLFWQDYKRKSPKNKKHYFVFELFYYKYTLNFLISYKIFNRKIHHDKLS